MARLMKEIKKWSNIYYFHRVVGIKDFRAIDTHQNLQLDGDRQFDTPQRRRVVRSSLARPGGLLLLLVVVVAVVAVVLLLL
jgi:hypothetical protein